MEGALKGWGQPFLAVRRASSDLGSALKPPAATVARMRFAGPLLAWACALAGILLLLSGAWAAEPPRAALPEVPAHEGARVTVAGRVAHAGGSAEHPLLVLTDGTHRVRVWLTGPGPVAARGDEVEVTGRVTVDRGEYTVSADERDARILSRASEAVLRVSEVAEHPERYAGTPVRVEGNLLCEGGAWWLRDAWANRALRLEGEFPKEAGAGEAYGPVRYAPQRAGYVLEVATWTPSPSRSP